MAGMVVFRLTGFHRFLRSMPSIFLTLAVLWASGGCQSDSQRMDFESKGRDVPSFSADSAYRYIKTQVSYGPRNPGSDGHQRTLRYLSNKLSRYAGNSYVYQQHFTHKGYNGDTLALSNVIASFNPRASRRILLCAHWDTRPRAEKARNHQQRPILGANDGASGVGVLVELARLFADNTPPVGVDIVLFDGEDYGKSGDQLQYFLGSRYWATHPPVEDYQPQFGILLDMVGGQNATFLKEKVSLTYAPALVNEIWNIADQMGYNSIFVDKEGAQISDDHVIVNQILGIPTINIIDHQVGNNGRAKFPSYWHTHRDSLNIIDKKTLKGVGRVITELIYNRL